MSSAPSTRPFNKPWLSCDDQLRLLRARGLAVADPVAAADFLSHVNYYRFSGYCLAFEQVRHRFLPGVTFEHIRQSYEFDRGLRNLLTEALEHVEIDFRAAVARHFGQKHGPFGHAHGASFFKTFAHADWLARLRAEAERSRELFVLHFKANYAEFPDLPVWMATEVMTFGALSLMLKGMHRDDQRAIASRYRLQAYHLTSCLHHLAYVRNLCAHHSRLWDRVWAIKPDLPPGKAWGPPLLPSNERSFATLLLVYRLLQDCAAASLFAAEWRARVHAHLASLPAAPRSPERLGLTPGWRQHPLWT